MFSSTKIIELGSCAFRQPNADSHCKFLHGYRLMAKFWFEAQSLDHNNWVVDFGGLKGLKNILQDQFDHTTCISKDDPYVDNFKMMADAGVCDLRVMDGVGIEKFAEWCHAAADELVQVITDSRCACIKVEVFEHENNSAIFKTTQNKEVANHDADQLKLNLDDTQHTPTPETTKTVDSRQSNVFSSNINKQTNTWVDKNAPKNSWLF